MRRAGGWFLGMVAVAAMSAGSWVAFRPILKREKLTVQFQRGSRDPSNDAMASGMRFALDEVDSRAGAFRVTLIEAAPRPPDHAALAILAGSSALLHVSTGKVLVAPVGTATFFPYYGVTHPPGSLPGFRELGAATARWALGTGTRRVVLLCDKKNEQSEEITMGFQTVSSLIDAPLDAVRGEGTPEAESIRVALIEAVLADKPDLVFYSGEEAPYGRAFEIFDALRKKGYAGPLVMGDADPEVSYLAVPTRVVEGTFLVSPIGPPSPEFAAAYEPTTGRHAGPHAWPGYHTMKWILRLLEGASSSDSEQLQTLLNKATKESRPSALYQFKEGKFVFVRDLE